LVSLYNSHVSPLIIHPTADAIQTNEILSICTHPVTSAYIMQVDCGFTGVLQWGGCFCFICITYNPWQNSKVKFKGWHSFSIVLTVVKLTWTPCWLEASW